MKGIHRAAGAAVIAAALTACADPVAPEAPASRPSLLIVGTSAYAGVEATSLLLTATCAPADTLSGSSTYIVAYGVPCGITPPDTAKTAIAPPPDSLQFKLTFR